MKKFIFLLLIPFAYFSCGQSGQEKVIKKPELVIIANDEIITMEQAEEYAKLDYVKAMHNGISDEEWNRLFEIFGDKIPPKEFIIYIELFTEKEKLEREKVMPKSVVKRNTTGQSVNVNDAAKDFTVQMIDGEKIKLSDLKGQVVLLNFWATWCAPCIREFHAFPSKIIEPFKNSAFVLLPISIGETEETVKNKMAELKNNGVDFNVGIDPDGIIANQYVNSGIPLNLLIDKNGIIRYISAGYTEEKLNNIASMIKKLLEE